MTVTITIKQQQDGRLVPFRGNREAKRVTVRSGVSIQWKSPSGDVTVNFIGRRSPFGTKTELAGGRAHKVTVDENRIFRYRCGVRMKGDGRVVGWPRRSRPGSGGEIEVVRRN
jgi:hypothetical protein